MTKRGEDLAIALSLSNLLLIAEWRDVALPPKLAYQYYDFDPLQCVAVTLAFFALGLAIFGLLRLSAGRPPAEKAVSLGLFLAFATALHHLLIVTELSSRIPLLSAERLLGNWGPMGNRIKFVIIALGGLAAWARFPRRGRAVSRGLCLALLPAILFTLGKTYWQGISATLRSPVAAPMAKRGPVPETRVVWLMFDELDQYFAFEQPAPPSLPNFAKLQSESLSASHAFSPATVTEMSLPAYIDGRIVTGAEPIDENDLALRFCGSPTPHRWSAEPSLFSQAHALGREVGLVGWAHPYCRVFGQTLDRCAAFPMASTRLPSKRLLPLVGGMLRRAFWLPSSLRSRETHRATYRRILEEAEKRVEDPHLGLVFIHWPVPHLSGFDETGGAEEYLANLALADEALGAVRARLRQSGLLAQTDLIVTSDHGVRWLAHPPHGQSPYHVPFYVHLHGTSQAIRYDPTFNAILAHDLALSLLKGEITTNAQLTSWLERHHRDLPVGGSCEASSLL